MADDAPPAPELALDAPIPPPMTSDDENSNNNVNNNNPPSNTSGSGNGGTTVTKGDNPPKTANLFSSGNFLDGLKNAKLKAVTKVETKTETETIQNHNNLNTVIQNGTSATDKQPVALLKGIELPAHLLIKNLRSSVAGNDENEESEDTDDEWGKIEKKKKTKKP